MRETLFNWLQPLIGGKTCLDLFAGSGALGFEALSRGAKSVTMVEKNADSAAMLVEQGRVLGAQGLNVVNDLAGNFLESCQASFDIVFLDPPFAGDSIQKCCQSLVKNGNLKQSALLYLESDSDIAVQPPYTIVKRSHAGKVQFALSQIDSGRLKI